VIAISREDGAAVDLGDIETVMGRYVNVASSDFVMACLKGW
jgi:hypothetical protein